MKKTTIQLEALTCPSCLAKIEGAVKRMNGVDKSSVKVLFNASKVKLNYDDSKIKIEQITQAIETVGYEVLNTKVK